MYSLNQPIRFNPWLRPMVWGGSKIAVYKQLPPTEGIGESWEISAVPGHVSVVSEGGLKGMTLTELVKQYKEVLVGKHVYAQYGDLFPLLIKFIDARRDLSIQVHPNDQMAQRQHGEPFGKTEMWYVVGADKNAFLLSGLKEQITPADYVQLVEKNEIVSVLTKHNIAPGDVFFLPAGRIHAIGSGAFIAEIQQTSDLTYRIYDYGRMGSDGKPRQLHTELAKEAIDYKVYDDYKTVLPVDCQYFHTSKHLISGNEVLSVAQNDSFLVLICISGSGRVDDVTIKQGESLLIPACMESVTLKGHMELLATHC